MESDPKKKKNNHSCENDGNGDANPASPDNEHEEEDSLGKKEPHAEDCSKHNYFLPDEDAFVGEILSKFLIGTESSFLDSINICLMLKAIPNKIVDINFKDLLKFNFAILQNSLIAFINADQVNAFDYFDLKNRDRVQKIKQCILEQKDDLSEVQEIMNRFKDTVQQNEAILENFQESNEHLKFSKYIAYKERKELEKLNN
jgi:hypothetical protein